MLVEILNGKNIFYIFGMAALVSIFWYYLICGILYLILTLDDRWRIYRTQLRMPDRRTLWGEIYHGTVSCLAASLSITLNIWCYQHGWSRMTTRYDQLSFGEHLEYSFWVWAITEVYQWWYHKMCHHWQILWRFHRFHHLYSNPTPFTVLCDHPVDMFFKSSPLFWIPLIIPVWDVTLYGWYGFVHLIYGAYLHSGYEIPWLPSKTSRWFVSSWHHNVHHSLNIPKNFCFYTRILDVLFDTNYDYEPQMPQEQFSSGSPL